MFDNNYSVIRFGCTCNWFLRSGSFNFVVFTCKHHYHDSYGIKSYTYCAVTTNCFIKINSNKNPIQIF